jgi:hypothetical protein
LCDKRYRLMLVMELYNDWFYIEWQS